jgi:hypothetical protein
VKYFSPTLLDGSVTTAKLADLAVTEPKFASFAVSNRALNNAIIRQNKIATTEVSLAGTVNGGSRVDITMTAFCLWPMLQCDIPNDVYISGHITDAPGSNNPRFSFRNTGGTNSPYDVDYRYINA